MDIIGYIASVFMGLVLGVTGGGGSILTVPILVYLFKLSPVTATGYSLFVVGCTALVGGTKNALNGKVAFKEGAIFAVPSFIGVYLSRAFLLPAIPQVIAQLGEYEITKDLLVMVAFAVLMLAASVSMIRGRKKAEQASSPQVFRISLQGFIVGIVTGFVGAGGGFLIVPALVMLVGLSMTMAVGTSLAIIAANSLVGFTGDLIGQSQSPNWGLLLTMSALSIAGILIGTRVARHLPDQTLKKLFGWFVLIMGTGILVQQITSM